MNITTIIATVLTTLVGSILSFIFARRKYKIEVTAGELDNLKRSIDLYEKIVTNTNQKLQFYIELSEQNRLEVYKLKSAVGKLLNSACLDFNCPKRKFYSKEEAAEILNTVIDGHKIDIEKDSILE